MRMSGAGLFGLDLEGRKRAGNVLRRRDARSAAEREHLVTAPRFGHKLRPGRGKLLRLVHHVTSGKPIRSVNDRLIRQASALPVQRFQQDVVVLACLGEAVQHRCNRVLRLLVHFGESFVECCCLRR